MKQKHLLDIARQLSKKSDHHTHKVGCVIAKGDRVLGSGFNLLKTHPKSPHAHKSIHAEFMAALNASYDIKGATAYIFREHRDGTWAISRPCKYCWKFLLDCGVKKVVYSFEGNYKQEEMSA